MPDEPVKIHNDDELFRRIFHYWAKPQGGVSSAAFKLNNASDRGVSIDLAKLTSRAQVLDGGKPGQMVVALKAETPRALGLQVEHNPLPDNRAHCLLVGDNSKDIREQLAAASWLVDS